MHTINLLSIKCCLILQLMYFHGRFVQSWINLLIQYQATVISFTTWTMLQLRSMSEMPYLLVRRWQNHSATPSVWIPSQDFQSTEDNGADK